MSHYEMDPTLSSWLSHPARNLPEDAIFGIEGGFRQAYAPYSDHKVVCYAQTSHGRWLVGWNIENGVKINTLHAEEVLISQLGLVSENPARSEKIERLFCISSKLGIIAPCGSCRQLLIEHMSETGRVELQNTSLSRDELIPHFYC